MNKINNTLAATALALSGVFSGCTGVFHEAQEPQDLPTIITQSHRQILIYEPSDRNKGRTDCNPAPAKEFVLPTEAEANQQYETLVRDNPAWQEMRSIWDVRKKDQHWYCSSDIK